MGHTCERCQPHLCTAVHPHICGAYGCEKVLLLRTSGSSPHTWGIRIHYGFPVDYQRFIPTYVGHTWASAFRPRTSSGSSPHTWGIRKTPHCGCNSERFIPTYVGHTQTCRCLKYQLSVHPHIRGAYVHRYGLSVIGGGSSPHTWGIRLPVSGSTSTLPVHPHIRGAYPLQQCPTR